MTMTMLVLATDAFGGYGGIAQYNRDALTAMARLPGVDRVNVLPRLTPESPNDLPDGIVQHRPVYGRLAYSLMATAMSVRRPGIVYSGHVYHGPLAWLLAKACGARLVSQLHGDEVWAPLSRLQLGALNASDLVLCVSRDTRDKYIGQGGRTDNAVVVSNTVGRDFVPGDRRAARARFGLQDETAILTVARLDPRGGYKGHDRIIPLLPRLRAEGRDLVYLIAGEGEDRSRLEALTRQHDVVEAVRFLGKVPRSDLPDLYRAADLFALPSTGEGFGISFLEAMACGTPAIGLALGGAPDALEGLGLCVREEAFADAFASFLSAPRRDPHVLSAAVHARFGFPAFQSRIAQAMSRLNHSDGLVGGIDDRSV